MRDIHTLRGIHGVIAHNMFYFDTLDAAFGIPFIHRNLSWIKNFHARSRRVTGKSTGISDMDAFFDIGAVSDARKAQNRKYWKYC